ncbi:MAG: hypothetical protein AAF585_06055 [Verrucomicrobiota bacterium]
MTDRSTTGSQLISLGSVVPGRFSKLQVRGVREGGSPAPGGTWVDALDGVDVSEGAIAGEWSKDSDGAVGIGSSSAGEFARLQLPAVVPDNYNYDVEAVARLLEGEESLVVTVPMPEERCAVLMLGASEEFAGISGLDGFLLEVQAPNVTKRPFKLEPDRDYKILVQARMTSPEIAQIGLVVDDQPVVNWSGEVTRLRAAEESKWTTNSSNQIAIGADNAAKFLSVRIQPNSEPLSVESAIDVEIAKLSTEYEGRIAAATGPEFETSIAALNQNYRAALDRVLNGTDEIAKRFARAEAVRLQNNEEIEPTDPDDMPQAMKSIRNVYRREFSKRILARDAKAYPMLQEQLQKLRALADGGSPMDARQVEQAAMVLIAAITEIEKQAAIAGITLSQAPPVMPDTPGGPFQRPTLPLSQPTERGAVIAWDRTGGNKREGMGRVPGGLSQTVVAISGGRDVAVALKNNGRVEVWGNYEYDLPESEINDLDDAVDVQASIYSSYFQVATLNRDGKIRIVTQGWDDSSTFTAQAHSLEKVVSMSVTAGSGIAVLEDGKTALWGQTEMPSSPLSNVVKIKRGYGLSFAIHEDGTATAWGDYASSFSNLENVRFLGVGTQSDAPGVVIGLTDGKFRAVGAFAPFEGDINEFAEGKTIRNLVVGFHAFAVEYGKDDRYQWKFFGQGISQEVSEEESDGCANLVIGREYIVAFRPL